MRLGASGLCFGYRGSGCRPASGTRMNPSCEGIPPRPASPTLLQRAGGVSGRSVHPLSLCWAAHLLLSFSSLGPSTAWHCAVLTRHVLLPVWYEPRPVALRYRTLWVEVRVLGIGK